MRCTSAARWAILVRMSTDKPADIISLSAYRQSRTITAAPPESMRLQATGEDEIELEIKADGLEGPCWLITRDGLRNLIMLCRRQLRAAELWNADKCRACGAKDCGTWHPGHIIERDGERYTFEGLTPGGRARLRSFKTGKIRYGSTGKVVGWVDITP